MTARYSSLLVHGHAAAQQCCPMQAMGLARGTVGGWKRSPTQAAPAGPGRSGFGAGLGVLWEQR